MGDLQEPTAGEDGEEDEGGEEALGEFSKRHTTPFSQRTALYDNVEVSVPCGWVRRRRCI